MTDIRMETDSLGQVGVPAEKSLVRCAWAPRLMARDRVVRFASAVTMITGVGEPMLPAQTTCGNACERRFRGRSDPNKR